MTTLLALLLPGTVLAAPQLPDPKPTPIVGARSLALSPDGTQLAFTYRGDVWVAPAEGGRATPVTNHVEVDDRAIWSPDGKWIAFTSNRFGNAEIFVVPAEGGETRRLTWHAGADVPSDWSPDGKRIIFRATRDDNHNGFYELEVATGKFRPVLLDMYPVNSPKYSADGATVFYNRLGFPPDRPRYQGSAAAQLWSLDLATGKRTQIRNNGFQHLYPSVGPDSQSLFTVTVSEKTPSASSVGKPIPKIAAKENAERCPNVYSVDRGGRARRITDYTGIPVRHLTAARKVGRIAYEFDGDIFLRDANGSPKKIALYAATDDKTTQEERLILTGEADSVSLSPKGDKFAFEVRGELWTIPVEKKGKGPNKDDATQLTDYEGMDGQPLWAPDGKSIFFVSDRKGAERLYRLDAETKAITEITQDDADIESLDFTPDKSKLSFWKAGKDGGLYTVPLTGGAPTRVFARSGRAQSYSWSPDGRFVAYSEVLLRSGYYYWESTNNVHVIEVATGKSTNVTRLSAQHLEPTWTPDGRYLLMRSDRDGEGVYALPLSPEDARSTELEAKYEKPAGPVKVEIDFTDISYRLRKLVDRRPDSPVLVDKEKGELYFLSEGDVWRASYSGEDLRRLTNGGGFRTIAFNDDQTKLAGLRNGVPVTVNLRRPDFAVDTIAFRADWTRDLRKERTAAFNQFWREYNRGFYDANFHGRDWVALRERYRKYLPAVGHRSELAGVLNMLVGELESSHAEVSPAPTVLPSTSSAHPGFTFDYGYAGPGIRIKAVPARTPGSYKKTKLEPGEIVEKINGKPVAIDEALWREVLNEQVGRDLTFSVKGKDGKLRDVTYRALSGGEFNGIVFTNRLRARREYVEKKSNGLLTYVHIAGMGEGPLRDFNREVWQYAEGKKGLIIDVRNNGGGNTSDRIIDVLERLPNSIYQPRDEAVVIGPGQALGIPMVVMQAETSYSNAEMFPYAMRARKLAKTVGQPTPGYVIYTGGGRLVDGTGIRMPGTGVYRLDGTPLENMAEDPDYIVDITVEQYFAGIDPQLDKAIDVLLKR